MHVKYIEWKTPLVLLLLLLMFHNQPFDNGRMVDTFNLIRILPRKLFNARLFFFFFLVKFVSSGKLQRAPNRANSFQRANEYVNRFNWNVISFKETFIVNTYIRGTNIYIHTW